MRQELVFPIPFQLIVSCLSTQTKQGGAAAHLVKRIVGDFLPSVGDLSQLNQETSTIS